MNREKWDPLLAERSEAFFRLGLDIGGKRAAGKLGIGWDIQNPRVQEWLRTYRFKFAAEINRRSDEFLRTAIAQGLDAGESIPQIAKRIESKFKGAIGRKRSITIARTEVKRASTNGQIEAWKQSGVVTGKVWTAFADHCPWCHEMDGKVVQLDQNYFDQGGSLEAGDFPRETPEGREMQRGGTMKFDYENVAGPPLHPGCRCVLTAQIIE